MHRLTHEKRVCCLWCPIGRDIACQVLHGRINGFKASQAAEVSQPFSQHSDISLASVAAVV